MQRGSDSPRDTVVASVPSTPDLKIVRSLTAPSTPVPPSPSFSEWEKLREENNELKHVKLEAAAYVFSIEDQAPC